MISPRRRRPVSHGFTVLELLVTLAVIGLLLALIVPAVQESREAARRIDCKNRLKQIGIALHSFESVYGRFPAGKSNAETSAQTPERSWLCAILPYVEQSSLWETSQSAYRYARLPYLNPPHTPLSKKVAAFTCPDDPQTERPQSASSLNGAYVGLTDYLGVAGTSHRKQDGVFFGGSATKTRDITDGLSNTLMVGERPPSPDFNFGWWYTGAGQDGSGSVDLFLGVEEEKVPEARNLPPTCARVSVFGPGKIDQPCDVLHFWSLHADGANFLWCDGSVRFMSYSSAGTIASLSTISGAER